MEAQRTLGRTGLSVTPIGLGGGGNSRLGLSLGQGETHAQAVVQTALELGVNLFDTARAYRTEAAVGAALKSAVRSGKRLAVSSKSGYLDPQGALLTPQAFDANIHASLKALDLETIDIYFIHGLRLAYYDEVVARFLPVLEKARQAGKIRFIGVTEAFESDTRHDMLPRAVQDDFWQVMMVGFNLINPSARTRVLAHTQRKGIGTLGMFAVRRGLIDEPRLRRLLLRLAEAGDLDPELAQATDLMETLGLKGVCTSLTEAAYRFCLHEPGLDCVLSGTSDPDHLRANLAAAERGPLPAAALARLEQLFGQIDSVSAQLPTA